MVSKIVRWVVLVGAALVLGAGLAACGGDDDEGGGGSGSGTGGTQASSADEPIVIGAAVDQSQLMRFFDGPALLAAQIRAEEINADGGVGGRPIQFEVRNTRLDPERTRAVALDLVNAGADVLWVTCDVDWATPSTQVGISEGLLTVAPCIGTDQMGPKRFGEAGQLAFSFGNVAQDEGAAMAKLAFEEQGWETAVVVADQAIAYTQQVCEAFATGFEELGGRVVARETFTEGDGTINNVVSSVNDANADVITMCATTQEDLPTFVSGVRTAGNETPILGPWSIDGAHWLPQDPQVSNDIWYVTYASVFGDDPSAEVQELIDTMEAEGQAPATGGFIAGASAVDAIAEAIERNDGSTDGAALAETLESFSGLETVSGEISFSPEFHTVFGREYRVIRVVEGKPRVVGTIRADSPVEIGG